MKLEFQKNSEICFKKCLLHSFKIEKINFLPVETSLTTGANLLKRACVKTWNLSKITFISLKSLKPQSQSENTLVSLLIVATAFNYPT